MRTNGFGDVYCQTVAEARETIENGGCGWEVYATEFSEPVADSQNPWDRFASCEIRENISGDLVCYLEASAMPVIKGMVAELKLKDTWA